MTFGTGPQALADYLRDNWQVSRSGRTDVPPTVTDPETEYGILVTKDRDELANQYAVHDLIHCYHPQASGLQFEDRGYNEKNVVEEVQIDIETQDRTDSDTGERIFAVERLVGDRDDAGFPTDDDPPYPGIFGECVYLLEVIRRDFEEWDVARMDVVNTYLGNSNANISVSVELEHIAANTVV